MGKLRVLVHFFLYPRSVLLIEVVEMDFFLVSRRIDLAFEHTTRNRTSFVTCRT